MRHRHRARGLRTKLVAGMVVLACVAIGLVGIVLPVIPGLLFLAIAALIVARNVPWIDVRLRTNASFARHMHRIDRFFSLGPLDQLRVGALLSVKWTCDLLDHVGEWLSRRAHRAVRRPS